MQVKGRDAVERWFTFKDFNEAWGFMSRSALLAEKVCGLCMFIHYVGGNECMRMGARNQSTS